MKFIYQITATVVGCFVVQYLLPWWTMPIAALGIGYVFQNRATASFFAGFIGVALLWFIIAHRIDEATQSLLTEKINRIFPLKVFTLMVIVGGLIGGFASLTGALMNPRRGMKYY